MIREPRLPPSPRSIHAHLKQGAHQPKQPDGTAPQFYPVDAEAAALTMPNTHQLRHPCRVGARKAHMARAGTVVTLPSMQQRAARS